MDRFHRKLRFLRIPAVVALAAFLLAAGEASAFVIFLKDERYTFCLVRAIVL